MLIAIARPLYAHESFGVELQQTAYALADCTTIDLCLSLFPWARYRTQNAAVKMHTLLDLHGNIPAFVRVAPAKIHEIHMLDQLLIEAGSIYIMDRAYLDFQRLHVLHQALAFFVIRARKDFAFTVSVRCPSTRPAACVAIRAFACRVFIPPSPIPSPCAVFATTTPQPTRTWSSSPTIFCSPP